MKKSEVYGAIGSITINAIIILLLCLIGLSADKTETPTQGIEIAFGDGADGSPAQTIASTPTQAAAPPAQSNPAPDLLAQEDPSIAIAAEQKRKEQQQREEQLRQQQIKIQQEAIRLEQQRKEEQQRAEQAAKANALASGAFGQGGNNNTGTGVGGGAQGNTPGNPLGKGTQGGNSWSLAGRDLKGAFHRPTYIGNQEGRIIVEITVDKNGNVIAAAIKKGTTISEETLREECKAAARKLKFTPDPKTTGNALGEIIYNFRQQ